MQNPSRYLGSDDIEGFGRGGYMHYCTRMIIYKDISIDPAIGVGGATKTAHYAQRYGDLGGWFKRKDGAVVKPASGDFLGTGTVWQRYRFPVDLVAYAYRDSRGLVGDFPFAGRTCAFIPGPLDPLFFWDPSASDLAAISNALSPTLSNLNELDQSWNLAVVAWMWAGWQHGPPYSQLNQPKQGLVFNPNSYDNDLRNVDECDVYYLAFIF